MVSVGSIVAKLQLNIDNFTQNLKNAEQQIKATEDKFSGFSDIGQRFTNVGKTMTLGVTAPVVAAGTAATNLAATFEEKLSKVKAISGATAEEMQMLKEKSIEMGAATKYSAGESADAMSYMAMAGWDAQQMVDGISGIMSLAAADGLDLATTADIVTDSLTAFGLKASDSAKFADTLAMAASASNTSVQMLGESFKYVAPVAGSLGYTAEDTSIALGLMANSGIKAGQAGTSLRAAITRMISPTDEAAGLMDKYGLAMTNSDGTMKSFAEVMVMLREKMGSLSEAEQAQAASTIFGQEAMSGMLAIVNAAPEDFNKLSESIYNSAGTADEMAATMQDNLKGKIEALTGAIETIGIQIGDKLLPIITDIVLKISEWVDWFGSLNDSTQTTIMVIAGIAAAIGPAILAIGTAITTWGKLKTSIDLIKTSYNAFATSQTVMAAKTKIATAAQAAWNAVCAVNPAVWVVAGIVALVAAFVLLWNKCEWFRDFWINLWEVLKVKVSVFWEWLKDVFGNVWDNVKAGWEGFKEGFIALWESVKTWFSELWNGIKNVVQIALDLVLQIWDTFGGSITQIFQGFVQYFTGIWEVIKNIFLGAVLLIIDLVTLDFEQLKSDAINIWNNLSAAFLQIWEGIKNIFSGALTFISTYISTVWNYISNVVVSVWTSITTWLSQTISNIVTYVSNGWNNMLQSITNIVTNIKNTIVSWFNSIVEWLRALPNTLYQIGSNMFTSMKNGVVNTVNGVYNAIVNGITTAINWIRNLPSQAATWGRHMIEGFIDGVMGTVGRLIDTVKGVGQRIRDFLGFSIPKKGPLHVYMEWMPHMIQGMTASLKDEAPLLYDAASDVAGSLSASMSASPEIQAQESAGGSGSIAQLTQTLQQFIQQVGTPTAVFNIDGRQFATATAGDMSKALAERMR